MKLEGFSDVSAILGPGVYALVKRGVVIYVGKSKSVYQRLYAHRSAASRAAKGKPIPTWLPIRGFVFDEVWVQPCTVDALDAVEAEMVERYKPRFNESLKTKAQVTVPIVLEIGGVKLTLNAASGELLRRV